VSDTVLDRIAASVRGALAYNANAHVAPVALLWPDEGGQWQPIIERLGEQLPLLSLGEYDPAARRGPAYWVRCVVTGTIDAGLPAGPPVVSCHASRAATPLGQPGELPAEPAGRQR
jgi:hypothetical protein